MLQEQLFEAIDAWCYDRLGVNPAMLKYQLSAMQSRLEQVESYIKESAPVIGAAVFKVEAISGTMIDCGLITETRINDKMRFIADAHSHVKRIE